MAIAVPCPGKRTFKSDCNITSALERAEPSIPRSESGRTAAAPGPVVHRRNPRKPRARRVRRDRARQARDRPTTRAPTGGPARPQQDRNPARVTRAGGPARKARLPGVGFRGSAAGTAAEGLKKEELPASRKKRQYLGEMKQLQVYNGRTIKKGAACNTDIQTIPKMEAGLQTGHEMARVCDPPDGSCGLGVALCPKTCAQCMDGSKFKPPRPCPRRHCPRAATRGP